MNRRRFRFTPLKLMTVIVIVASLMSIGMPIYSRSIVRGKESLLKNNLFTLRTVIHEYTWDKQKAPPSLNDLVSDGYLRQIRWPGGPHNRQGRLEDHQGGPQQYRESE